MNSFSYEVSLRVTHQTNNLTDAYNVLSQIPGVIPGRFVNAYNHQVSDDQKDKEKNFKSWFFINLTENIQDNDLTDLSIFLLGFLQKIKQYRNLFNEVVLTGGRVVFFIGLYINANSGVIFDDSLIQELSKMGIGLELDIYPPDK